MSLRTVIVGILAAICGVAATIGIYRLQAKRPVVSTAETQPVVVTRMAVEYGNALSSDHLQVVNWPANLVPEGALSKTEEAIGQYPVSGFVANEPVTSAKLETEPTYLHLPEGMRAVTIQTSKESSIVAGLIAAGNRVDVILTITRQTSLLGGPTTLTLLENIEVLAVGQDTKKAMGEIDPKRDARSVTLLVTPEMAEELNLGAAVGTLNLALRSFEDDDVEPRKKISLQTLFRPESEETEKREEEEQSETEKLLASELSNLKTLVQDMQAKAAADQLAAEKLKALEEQQAVEQKFNIPSGMRAMSILTPTDASGVAGLIQPGDHVDVILTAEGAHLGKQDLPTTTLTLLEKVQVLAVGTKVETDENGTQVKLERSVTLLVTPEIAQDLNLAGKVGTLSLTLRGEEDEQIAGPLRTVNLAELLTQATEAPAVVVESSGTEADRPLTRNTQSIVRVYGGPTSSDMIFYHRPEKKKEADQTEAKP